MADQQFTRTSYLVIEETHQRNSFVRLTADQASVFRTYIKLIDTLFTYEQRAKVTIKYFDSDTLQYFLKQDTPYNVNNGVFDLPSKYIDHIQEAINLMNNTECSTRIKRNIQELGDMQAAWNYLTCLCSMATHYVTLYSCLKAKPGDINRDPFKWNIPDEVHLEEWIEELS